MARARWCRAASRRPCRPVRPGARRSCASANDKLDLICIVAPMLPALKISHLRKVYRRGTVAVKDLSLTIEAGDFFGFLGPNGAGKSTTIHCVTGIATLTSGTIEVFGIDAVKNYREARRMIGLSPQEFNVDTFANPRQIVDWMGGYFGMSSALRKSRTDMLLERFDLTDHAKKEFRELSG